MVFWPFKRRAPAREDAVAVVPAGDASTSRKPKNKKERLQFAESEASSLQARLEQARTEQTETERRLADAQRRQAELVAELAAVEKSSEALRAANWRTTEELRQTTEDKSVATDDLERLLQEFELDSKTIVKLEVDLRRLKAACSGMGGASFDVRRDLAGLAAQDASRDAFASEAGRLSQAVQEDMETRLFDAISDAASANMEEAVTQAERGLLLSQLNALRADHGALRRSHEVAESELKRQSVENEEHRLQLRKVQADLNSAQLACRRLQGQGEEMVKEIRRHGDRAEELGKAYNNEVVTLKPLLATAKTSKHQADAIHEQRLSEIEDALKKRQRRFDRDAQLADPRPLSDPSMSCSCEAPAITSYHPPQPNYVPEPLEEQLQALWRDGAAMSCAVAAAGVVR